MSFGHFYHVSLFTKYFMVTGARAKAWCLLVHADAFLSSLLWSFTPNDVDDTGPYPCLGILESRALRPGIIHVIWSSCLPC